MKSSLSDIKLSAGRRARLRAVLLDWYDASGRSLPWRVRPEGRAAGITADPYAVWLSEIMLQQTTVPHAAPYWQKFLARFPRVTDLADAQRDEVLTMWAGLGYYARARNLHKCAQVIRDEYDGRFPATEEQLLKLPGVGAYTAAAISSICFDVPANVVDGNVERVISRLFAVEAALPKAKNELRGLAGLIVTGERPGDYAQALMDLGATVCKPTSPECSVCPWSYACQARKGGQPQSYPRKIKKAKLPTRYGAVFWAERGGQVLIRQRPDKGLLGGMMEFPGTRWSQMRANEADWLTAAPFDKNWERLGGVVTHVFSHFRLELTVFRAQINEDEASMATGKWAKVDKLSDHALPSVMVKVSKAAR